MTITHNLTMDLQKKGELQRIDVVQGDAFTRNVALTLLSGGESWEIPVCEPVVRYLKPDGTAGAYDRIMGSVPAITISYNVITLALAPEMLDLAGVVQVQVELHAQDLRLGVFPFLIVVDPALGQEVI